jgi:hypothetical protein
MPTVLEWREVPGYPAYRVWSDGTYQSRWRRKLHSAMESELGEWSEKRDGISAQFGYRHISLSDGCTKKRRALHSLIAECFLGPRPQGMHCCHNDGNPSNNWLSNLRWDTPVENARDKKNHGTNRVGIGVSHARAILNDDIVLKMKALRTTGMSYSRIGRLFGVSESCTLKAVTGRTWKHIREPTEDDIACLISGL